MDLMRRRPGGDFGSVSRHPLRQMLRRTPVAKLAAMAMPRGAAVNSKGRRQEGMQTGRADMTRFLTILNGGVGKPSGSATAAFCENL